MTGILSDKKRSRILEIAYETNVMIDGGDVVLDLGKDRVVVKKTDFEALEKRVKELQEKVERLEYQAQQVQES